jgi:hypothetical protein
MMLADLTFAGLGLTPLGSLFGGFLGQEWGLRVPARPAGKDAAGHCTR